MLSHQVVVEGVATGELSSGWRDLARKEFRLKRQELWKVEKRLRDAGVIESKPYERKVRLVPGAFDG